MTTEAKFSICWHFHLSIQHGEKGKNPKDFDRPHRGQILVTDSIVTVPRWLYTLLPCTFGSLCKSVAICGEITIGWPFSRPKTRSVPLLIFQAYLLWRYSICFLKNSISCFKAAISSVCCSIVFCRIERDSSP